MNKRTKFKKIIEERLSVILDIIGEPNKPTKKIYIVKCDEVHYVPNHNIKRNNTYLSAFESLEMARSYMNLAHEVIVSQYTMNEEFKILISPNAVQIKSDDGILYKKYTKLIGNTEFNNSQTKLFTFTVEMIDYKPI